MICRFEFVTPCYTSTKKGVTEKMGSHKALNSMLHLLHLLHLFLSLYAGKVMLHYKCITNLTIL